MPRTLSEMAASILAANSRFLGIDDRKNITNAGIKLASLLQNKFPSKTSFAFVCGAGNNEAVGFVAAKDLARNNPKTKVNVYFTGRSNKFSTETAAAMWEAMKMDTPSNLTFKQDCKADDIENHEVIIDCLTEKKEDKVGQRHIDIIKRCSHFRQTMVAFEYPTPGYTPDWAISLSFPKTKGATVITIRISQEAELNIGPGEVQALFEPRQTSHKAQNGKLLIIGGAGECTEKLSLAARAASWYVGHIFVFNGENDKNDSRTAKEMKSLLSPIEHISADELENAISQSDAVLMGLGWNANIPNKALANYILASWPEKTYIIEGNAVKMSDLRLTRLLKNVLFIMNRSSLLDLIPAKFANENAAIGRLKRFCLDNNCFLNLKGSINLLFGRNPFTETVEVRMNKVKNPLAGSHTSSQTAFTAGLSAALATKNDLWLSMSGAAFLEHIAVDVEMLPQTWKICREF